ncbi:hypothetical protein ACROYT_G006754, partial [Oculina patagonica]
DDVELRFVDENDFKKQGNWYFESRDSEWELNSTISSSSDDSLAGISDFNEEFQSDSPASWRDDESDDADEDYIEEASTSKGKKKGRRSNKNQTNAKQKESSSGSKQQKSARPSTDSSKAASKPKAKAKKARGKKKQKALTKKELDDLANKLTGKRHMCWNFVSERIGKQYVTKHFETHRKLFQEILDVRYNELRDLVQHMYSLYITLLSDITKEVKKDKKARLTLRWMESLNSYLDRSSDISKICSPVFSELENEHSSSTIRAVTGILHSLVYDFAQTESYHLAQPPAIEQVITPEDDVSLYRMSGAALCKMIKLRKDTLAEKKGKRKPTQVSRDQMELELDLLVKLRETDKSQLPEALKILDEGHLTFVKKDFLDFVREADINIREYVNERCLNKHKSNFLEVVHFNVYNDEQLLKSFKWSANKCGVSIQDVSSSVVDKVYNDMLHKLCNTRTKEFFRGKFEKDLASSGKVVEADQSLRDNLKTFSICKKR